MCYTSFSIVASEQERMALREYSGFFGLNLAGGKEYFHEGNGYDLLRVNAARYGILESLRDMGLHKVLLSHYLCVSVRDALQKEKVACSYYSIDESMLPPVTSVPEDTAIVITNYFGLLSDTVCQELAGRYKRVIFDFTQSFFARPVLRNNVYCVYL